MNKDLASNTDGAGLAFVLHSRTVRRSSGSGDYGEGPSHPDVNKTVAELSLTSVVSAFSPTETASEPLFSCHRESRRRVHNMSFFQYRVKAASSTGNATFRVSKAGPILPGKQQKPGKEDTPMVQVKELTAVTVKDLSREVKDGRIGGAT